MKSLLETLKKKRACEISPVWMMRQAGRYLPEYRAVRKKAGSFLDLAYHSDLAAEVTIQPIRRYGMDGAILFSDILIVPHALGQGLTFVEGEGPVLDVNDLRELSLEHVSIKFSKICETVSKVRETLDREYQDTTMIGFSGSPWTVACYMVQGHGQNNQLAAFPSIFRMIEENPKALDRIIDLIVEATVIYLKGQVKSGAEILKVFDSWAGLLKDKRQFEKYVIMPTQRIIGGVRKEYPEIPFIGFPRHVPVSWLDDYIEKTKIDGLAVGEDVKMSDVKTDIVLQGNLDNQLLLKGGEDLKVATKNILDEMQGRPFIFNLGHGVIKETDPENIKMVLDVIRS